MTKEPRKIKVKVSCEVETSFESFGNKKMNNAFRRQIRRWIEELLRNEAKFIPHYVDGEEHVTKGTKIWVFLDE